MLVSTTVTPIAVLVPEQLHFAPRIPTEYRGWQNLFDAY
jgi:hypothetical protein